MKKILTEQFDLLFVTKTRYDLLDQRIAATAAKKEKLLLALTYPFCHYIIIRQNWERVYRLEHEIFIYKRALKMERDAKILSLH